MVTQNPLTQARKLKLRWFVTFSALPLLAVVSAFGIIPQSEIGFTFNNKTTEEITLPLIVQPADKGEVFWRTERVQRGDTVAELLRRLNVDDAEANMYLRNNKATESFLRVTTGKNIQAETRTDGSLVSLRYLSNDNHQIIVSRDEHGFHTNISSQPVEKRIFMRTGEINSTLYAATDDADIPDSAANQMAEIFSGDIDFHRDLRKGDKFAVIYEVNFINGEPVGSSNVLAAEFINQGRQYKALYYEITPNHGSYYSPDGKSMRKSFLRSPLEFSRVSSGFSRSRFHPALNKWRAHKGVDYAAAIGTKVKVTADGTIAFVGNQNGYGNVVIVNHQGNYSTVYGHLSRFAKGLQRGQRVSQGDIIAYTGKTGLVTGPHLHYEFKINGQHHDPLRVALPDAKPISAMQLIEFKSATASLNARLGLLSNNLLAQAN